MPSCGAPSHDCVADAGLEVEGLHRLEAVSALLGSITSSADTSLAGVTSDAETQPSELLSGI